MVRLLFVRDFFGKTPAGKRDRRGGADLLWERDSCRSFAPAEGFEVIIPQPYEKFKGERIFCSWQENAGNFYKNSADS